MTTLLERVEVKTRTYCFWCLSWSTVGSHGWGGRFDPHSVEVTAEEIDQALRRANKPFNNARLGRKVTPNRSRETIRYAIALGKHIGTRD